MSKLSNFTKEQLEEWQQNPIVVAPFIFDPVLFDKINKINDETNEERLKKCKSHHDTQVALFEENLKYCEKPGASESADNFRKTVFGIALKAQKEILELLFNLKSWADLYEKRMGHKNPVWIAVCAFVDGKYGKVFEYM